MTPPPLAFLGLFAGGWKIALVAAVTAAIFWRRLAPWVAASSARSARVAPGKARRRSLGDRFFLVLVVMAAAAASTWVVLRFAVSTPSARVEARARTTP